MKVILVNILMIIAIGILTPSCDDNGDSKPGSPPEARATVSPDTGFVNTAISLDGSNSSDPDGDSLRFSWSIVSTPDNASRSFPTTNTNQARVNYNVAGPGEYVFELSVSDGIHDPVTTQVTFLALTNSAPTAVAPDDQTVNVNENVTLDGSNSSDPEDGSNLEFSWAITSNPPGSNAAISNSNQAVATFTPDQAGVYNIELSVRDQAGSRDSDQVTITAE